MLCSTIPVVAKTPEAVAKTIGECGKWITFCGKGKHSVSLFLGTIQAPIVIWYERDTPEDALYVHQFDEVVAAAPLDDPKGSFTFQYAPLDKKEGNDEIIITHEGHSVNSRVHVRVDCPESPCLPDNARPPQQVETFTKCGKSWHQAGYVKKNTILLGEEPGYVDVIWEVMGTAEVRFFQDKTLLKTITSNRDGTFSFYYDPELGEVYAMTQGTGSVDYIFTCPFNPVEPEEPVYEFTCGPTAYAYEAPRSVEVKLPVEIGTIEIEVTLVETVRVEFRQNNVPFYVLSNHAGVVTFSYDYDPDKGKVTIETTGYGAISVKVKCPFTTPDPDPVDVLDSCGTTLETFPGWSNVTLDMGGISGKTIMDFVLTGTPVTVEHTVVQQITVSGSYEFDVNKDVSFVIKSRGNDYRMRASCPVRIPVEEAMDCGTEKTIDSYSNTIIRYGSTPGNTTITSNLDVSVYRDGVLQGMGKSITFFYAGSGVVKVVSLTTDQQLTLNATCPAVNRLPCNDPLTQFNGGDSVIVDFAIPNIRGHVKFEVEITGTVSIAWRVGNVVVKTSTTTENFELILRTVDGLRAVSTGTGTFRIKVYCATPIVPVEVVPFTEVVNCQPGQTSGGVPGGDTFVTASWTVTTYSDGSVVTSEKSYDGICMPVAEVPIRPARWGVAMFANRLFTGGPIESEITDEERDYGVRSDVTPYGKPYTHWTGFKDFADKVMTNTVTLNNTTPVKIDTVAPADDYIYLMWDKRAGPDVEIRVLPLDLPVTWLGIALRNDVIPNGPDFPEYDPNLPVILTVRYDDGTGERDWYIRKKEDTALQGGTLRESYTVKYKV